MNLNLVGVLPPVPTPFEGGHFAPKRLAENFARWHTTGLSGYLVLGSNGEAAYLSDAEKLEIVRVARREIPQEKLLLVGTGLEATDATRVLTCRVADLGADAALVITPSYYQEQMTMEALRRHYETVAENSPIPILLYNVPKFTHLNLPPDWVRQLAQHPNIIGMKDSAGNLAQLIELREKMPPDFRILVGSDPVFFAGLQAGAKGAILAIANIAPRICVALYQAVQEKNWEEAQTLARRLAPLGRVVVQKYGVPGLKAAMDEMGYFGGEARPPLSALKAEQIKEVCAVMHDVELP
ncbi:MAG: dihydrodipicolinate synthase family protein [bacterium]